MNYFQEFTLVLEKKLKIGHLTTRKDVEIGLAISGFRRHVAIIAQTGAGKSYLAGVLMEELLENGAIIIVLDPHADYVRLSIPNNEGWSPALAKRVFVYRATRSMSRYADIRNVKPLSIRLNDLSLEEIFYITGIEERFVKIRHVIEQVVKRLKKRESLFSLKDLIEEVKIISESEQEKELKDSATRALYYLYRLQDIVVLGDRTTDIKEILAPWRLSVIDLSGLSDRESDLIAYLILKEVFKIKTQPEDEKFKYPVFLFIEEAQRFIPPPVVGSTYSGELIKRIAAEGRKFGIFLTLVTQRPSKVHPDVLSQCNSQIIMRITNPIDQKAVIEASERLGKELLDDLPSLGRGEAVIVGEIINVPAVVMVRKRRSFEGGSDIDVDGLLEDALKQAREEEKYKNGYYKDWEEFKKRSEPK